MARVIWISLNPLEAKECFSLRETPLDALERVCALEVLKPQSIADSRVTVPSIDERANGQEYFIHQVTSEHAVVQPAAAFQHHALNAPPMVQPYHQFL